MQVYPSSLIRRWEHLKPSVRVYVTMFIEFTQKNWYSPGLRYFIIYFRMCSQFNYESRSISRQINKVDIYSVNNFPDIETAVDSVLWSEKLRVNYPDDYSVAELLIMSYCITDISQKW